MFEYLYKIATVWFLGFFPAFEIYVAVPAGIALGLDSFSVLFFSVFGNFTPVLFIEYGHRWLMRFEWMRARMNKPVSEKLERYVNKYGIWYILLATPWTGVWLMGISVKALNINRKIFFRAALCSIFLHGAVILVFIKMGINLFTS